jgi:hypothetical protein
MRREHPEWLRRMAEEGEVSEPVAIRRFVDAVLVLLDDPQPDNVERYLVASRALERDAAPASRGLTKGRT